VDAALAGGADTVGFEQGKHGRALQLPAALKTPLADGAAARQCVFIDAKLFAPSSRLCQPARGQQFEQPAHVGCGDQVQRAAHRPRAHDRAVVQRRLDLPLGARGEAQADGPQRAQVVLRLHGEQVRDHCGRRGAVRGGDLLVVEAAGDEGVHDIG